MTLVVPFDGSDLSRAALVRAVQFDAVLDEGVLVMSVIPKNNAEYARTRGWIDESEPFDAETVVSYLRNEVAQLAPEAEFHYEYTDRYAPTGTIASRIRRFAKANEASIVIIGSRNAGRIVSAITVGQSVAGDRAYDTMIVSQAIPPKIEKLEEEVPAAERLS
ncbi:universal stress protein [Halovenus marina]|uniref:universal stress protein n=1 Tax=Halovenus marina TaxID=3396621 RepID=UPI003F5704ED